MHLAVGTRCARRSQAVTRSAWIRRGCIGCLVRVPSSLGLALVVAIAGREALAQRRGHRRLEVRPDAATVRRCGEPIGVPGIDRFWPGPLPDSEAWHFRWSPASPCFREHDQRERAIRAFAGARIALNCWQNLLRMNPSAREEAVRITLTINTEGRFADIAIDGSPDPRFDACVRSGVGRIAPLDPGPRVEAVAAMNLTTGG